MKKNRIPVLVLSFIMIFSAVSQHGLLAEELSSGDFDYNYLEAETDYAEYYGNDEQTDPATEEILSAGDDWEYVTEEAIPFVQGYVQINKGATVYRADSQKDIVGSFTEKAVAYAVLVSGDIEQADSWLWITFDTIEAKEADEIVPNGYVQAKDVTVMPDEEIAQLIETLREDITVRNYNDNLLPVVSFEKIESKEIESSADAEENVIISDSFNDAEEDLLYESTEDLLENVGAGAADLPVVVTQPTNVETAEGSEVTLTVEAENVTNYRWQYSSNGGAKWSNVPTGWTGYASASLTFVATASRANNIYRVELRNEAGKVYSEAASITLVATPVIIKQPANVEVAENSEVTLTVEAENVTNYRWQYSSNGGAKWSNVPTGWTGYASDSLTFVATASRANNIYRVELRNEAGKVYSESASITLVTTPVIITQPANVEVVENNEVTLTVEAENVTNYRWQYSSNGGSSWSNIPTGWTGYASASLTFTATASRAKNIYRVELRNASGKVYSEPASVTLVSLPVVITQPASVEVAENSEVTLTVEAENVTNYRWQYSSNGGSSWSNVPTGWTGYASASLTFIATASRAKNIYRVELRNASGKVYSEPASVTLVSVPVIITQPANVEAAENSEVTLTVEAENVTNYRWQYSSNGGSSWSNIPTGWTGYASDSLTFIATTSRARNIYRVELRNASGKIYSEPASVTLVAIPVIITQPASVEVAENSEVTFTVEAENVTNYRWQYSSNGGVKWSNVPTGWTGYASAALTFIATASRANNIYRVELRNEFGKVYSEAAGIILQQNIVIDDVTYEAIDSTTCKVISYVGTAANLVIPETVEGMTVVEIGEEAFMGNTTLESIDLPDTIVAIRARAFKNCANLCDMH